METTDDPNDSCIHKTSSSLSKPSEEYHRSDNQIKALVNQIKKNGSTLLLLLQLLLRLP